MAERRLDRIHIRDLRAACVIGVFPKERGVLQDVVLDITLEADLSTSCATDALADTVDYKAVKNRVLELVGASSFGLIERLAAAVADVCLEDPRVQRCTVTVDKPGALTGARSVAVEIERVRR